MDIERFKNQHVEILERIDTLRTLAHRGIARNALSIAQQVRALGDVVKVHLAIEDRILYPAVQQAPDTRLASMAWSYQNEMKGIASAAIRFTNKWADSDRVVAEPDDFRAEANTVLRDVYERMQRENHEFYPAIESM